MYRWMLIGLAVLGLVGRMGAQQQDTLRSSDYTCDDVRQGQGGRKTETNPYIPFDSLAINSRQKAMDFVQEVQRRAHMRALETGTERAVPVMWAIRKVKKYLSCDDILHIIIADVRFYDKHLELLPQGTYPWSVAGLPCARNWLKKELQRKDVSRLYHAWLIVEASRVWYEPYRDSLFKIILDTTYPREIRFLSVASLRDTSDTTINLLLHLLTTPQLETRVDSRNHLSSIQHQAFIMLRFLKKLDVVPESIRTFWEKKEYERKKRRRFVASIDVAYYFPYHRKFNGYLPAWFAFWKQAIVRFAPALNEGEIVYVVDPSLCHHEFAAGCFLGGRTVGVTEFAGGWGAQYNVGPTYKGIDWMGVVVFHELGHRNVADSWTSPDLEDSDGDGIPDSVEVAGIWVGLGTFRPHALLYQSNPTLQRTHTFYNHTRDPLNPKPDEEFDDQEIYAMLQGCVWEEGMADTLDWSWDYGGDLSRQENIPLDPVEDDSLIHIVFPRSTRDRRWVMWEDSTFRLRAEAKDSSVGKIRWVVEMGEAQQVYWTRPGEELSIPAMPLDPFGTRLEHFGVKTITAHGVARLCLLAHTPEQGEQGVPVTSPVVLAFSHPMDTASVHTGTIYERVYIPSLNA